MKLSTRLKLSFAILIIVPIILFCAMFIGLASFKVYEFKSAYGAHGTSYETLANPIQVATNICRSEWNELLDASNNNPESFSDREFLEKINKELEEVGAFIIVVQEGECTFDSNGLAQSVLKELSLSDYDEATYDRSIYLGGNLQMIVNGVGYSYGNTEGTAYIVIRVSELIPQMKMLYIDGIIGIVLVLVLTSACFITWIYKATVNPINKLKLATQNIKNGNLDFDIKVKGHDEISGLCRDFDDMRLRLKENAEEKIKNDAESKELLCNISHDLKTPITAIKGYASGILDGVVTTPEKLEKYIKTIYNKACDMDKLIDELTFYAKIDANKIPYNFIKLDISEYFNDCVDELGTELESQGISLTYDNRITGDAIVMADPEQFKKVINNIISNSVKYMDKPNKMIAIKLYDDDDWVHIWIQDNAKGIAQEDIGHIFDRFYRTDSSRNSKTGGNGIGLSIVKKIVEDHSGIIEAQSAEGEGTTMKISLLKLKESTPAPAAINQ